MKNTIILLLILLICFGCNEKETDVDISAIQFQKSQRDTTDVLLQFNSALGEHIKWKSWLNDRIRKVNKILERDLKGWSKLDNYQQAVILRGQVREILAVYDDGMPESPKSVDFKPLPSPLPDTTKPIKDSGAIDWSDIEMRCGVAHCTEAGCFSCDYKGHYYPFMIYNDSITRWFIKMVGSDSLFYYRHPDDTLNYIWNGGSKDQGCGYDLKYGKDVVSSICQPYNGKDTVQIIQQVWDEFPLIPKPSPIPDTSKPIKDKIKMQPRWRDDEVILDSSGGKPFCNDITKGFNIFYVDTSGNAGYIGDVATSGPQMPMSDTTKVILLCSDTSSQNGFRSSRCFWMYGYEISEPWFLFNEGPPAYKNIGYLDESKRPLPKNIVVWMSKELK